jgi:hypothetical protein
MASKPRPQRPLPRLAREMSLDCWLGPGLKGLFRWELAPVMKHPVSEGSIRDHIQQGGRAMPAFPQIKGHEMDALIAYLKTL